jgi:hypothetical protein
MNDRMILARVSRDETTFALVEFAGVDRLDLKRSIQRAVTAWVKNSESGRRAYPVTHEFPHRPGICQAQRGHSQRQEPVAVESICLIRASVRHSSGEVTDARRRPSPKALKHQRVIGI